MTIPSSENYFWYVFNSHPKLVILQPQINFREVTRVLGFIKSVTNPWERIFFPPGDLIELTIINAHPKRPILFLNKQH